MAMFSIVNKLRKINRRRFQLKQVINNRVNIDRKVMIYLFRSNKNFHVMVVKNGHVVIGVNSIKCRKSIGGPMREVVRFLAGEFYKKFIVIYPYTMVNDVVFDIRHYFYGGNVKLFVELFKSCLKKAAIAHE